MEPLSAPPVIVASPVADGPGGPRDARVSGWMLAAIGVILSACMAVLIHSYSLEATHQFQSGGAVYRQSNQEFRKAVFELYGSTFLFGLVCFATGIYQVRTAKRSRWLNVLLMLAAGGIVYFAWRMASVPTQTLLGAAFLRSAD